MLVLGITSPIGPCKGEEFEVLQIGGIWNMGTTAKVDKIALFIHGDRGLKFRDVLGLIGVILEDFESLFDREFLSLIGDSLFAKLPHLRFNRREIGVGDLLFAEIDIVIEAFLNRGAKAELGFWIKMVDSLRHKVAAGVVHHLETLFIAREDKTKFAFRNDLVHVIDAFADLEGQSLLAAFGVKGFDGIETDDAILKFDFLAQIDYFHGTYLLNKQKASIHKDAK